jgi:hypothetical protein
MMVKELAAGLPFCSDCSACAMELRRLPPKKFVKLTVEQKREFRFTPSQDQAWEVRRDTAERSPGISHTGEVAPLYTRGVGIIGVRLPDIVIFGDIARAVPYICHPLPPISGVWLSSRRKVSLKLVVSHPQFLLRVIVS